MKEDLIGKKINKWTVLEEKEGRKFECVCECGRHKIISRNALVSGRATSCGKCDFKPLNGRFNEWTIIKYIGNKKYLCRCSCGKESVVDGYSLTSGRSKSCGHTAYNNEDLTGRVFGEWTVIERDHNNFWVCKCSCGNKQVIEAKYLRSGKTTHCKSGKHRFTDLTGKTFGHWKVLRYAGDHKWVCRCSCGTEREVYGGALTGGYSKSCGCEKYENSIRTMLERYGDMAPARADSPREAWQLEVLYNKSVFIKYINELGYKPTADELSKLLNTDRNVILKIIHRYSLLKSIDYEPSVSNQEKELYDFIKSIYDGEIQRSNRTIIKPYELDIYIPDKRMAIEFNGSYWHSEGRKDSKYHQRKTLMCAKLGIRLVHVFEYEWDDPDRRSKVEMYLKGLFQSRQKIYGRYTEVRNISFEDAMKFEDKYHINGGTRSSINLGLFYNGELLAVMTFGTPRFTDDYEYELIRYCCKFGVMILGGAEKLFKRFLTEYNPNSVICYSDISKFTGNIYTRLGFKCSINDLTQPNYVWVNTVTKDIKTRYQVTKQRLVKAYPEKQNNTESEIMEGFGYMKVYDSGNLRLVWLKA